MNNKNQHKFNKSNEMVAKLSMNEGFREMPIYKIKAKVSEKKKGIDMLELIEQNFNISEKDRKEAFKIKMKELEKDFENPTIVPKLFKQEKIKWTRDDKGRIVSPFPTKKL